VFCFPAVPSPGRRVWIGVPKSILARQAKRSRLKHQTATVDHPPGYFSFLPLYEQLNPVGEPMVCGVLFGLRSFAFAHGPLLLGPPKNVSKIVAGLDRVLDFGKDVLWN
jgi:hypothetical protein